MKFEGPVATAKSEVPTPMRNFVSSLVETGLCRCWNAEEVLTSKGGIGIEISCTEKIYRPVVETIRGLFEGAGFAAEAGITMTNYLVSKQ